MVHRHILTWLFVLVAMPCSSAVRAEDFHVLATTGSTDAAGRSIARIDPWVSVNNLRQVGFRATTIGTDGRHKQNVFTTTLPDGDEPVSPAVPLIDPILEFPESGERPWQEVTPPQLNDSGLAIVRRRIDPILTLSYIDAFTLLPVNMTQYPPMTYIEAWRADQTSTRSAQLVEGADPGIRPLVENVFPLILVIAFFNPASMGCWPPGCADLTWPVGYPSGFEPLAPHTWIAFQGPRNESFPTMNNLGQAAYTCLGDTNYLTTTGLTRQQSLQTPEPRRPRLSDDGKVVLYLDAAGPAIISANVLNPTSYTVVAGPSQGFTNVGLSPSISDSGQLIAFYADLNEAGALALSTCAGPGIFVRYVNNSTSKMIRVAGASGNACLDPGESFDDVNGNGILDGSEIDVGNIASFHPSHRIGINNAGIVTFLANKIGETKALFSTRLNLNDDSAPLQAIITFAGDDLGGLLSSPIADIALYDPLTNEAVPDIAFWASLANGTQAVIGTTGCTVLCGDGITARAAGDVFEFHNWSFETFETEDDGTAIRNVRLGQREMIAEVSIPYLTIKTSKMDEVERFQLQAAPLSCATSRLLQHITFSNPTRVVDETTYLLRGFSGASESCLRVTQRFEFLTQEATHPFEPSGELMAQSFRPVVSYEFFGRNGETLQSINVPLRIELSLDAAEHSSTAIFRDSPGAGTVNTPTGPQRSLELVQTLLGNPLPTEQIAVALVNGARGEWDNIHASFVDRIQTPILTSLLSCPHGASEAFHMHWYWLPAIDYAPGCHLPQFGAMIPAGSQQSLDVGVVGMDDDADPIDWKQLVDGEPLSSGTQVLWLSATSSAIADTFFEFGGAFENGIGYLGPGDISEHAHVWADNVIPRDFDSRVEATIVVRSNAEFNLIRGPVFLEVPIASPFVLHAPAPAGTSQSGFPFFQLDNFGRDGVLSPIHGGTDLLNLAVGERTQDTIVLTLSLEGRNDLRRLTYLTRSLLANSRVFSVERP